MAVMKRAVKIERKYLLATAVVAVLFAVLIVRAFFSMPLDDELCYIASLKRYLQGDRFLLDDWHPPTQLNTWLIFQLVRWIPDFYINILQARMVYICFQFIVGLIIWRLLKGRTGIETTVFVYLCFTPYNINALSYNTMSIASFFILTALCLSRKQWKRRDYMIGGFLLCLSMFSNPYLFLVYLVYLLICAVRGCKKRTQEGLFSCRGILWVTCGALVLGGGFVISLIGKGSFTEYLYNIKMIFNDAEHKANPLVKLLKSQWQVFRVYWRCSIPLICIYTITIFKGKDLDEKWKKYLFCISTAFAVYAVIRFSFIYGSIANNLMMVPFFFLGVEVFLLTVCGENVQKNIGIEAEGAAEIKKYFGALVFGYLFAVCNFLGTNTEILSMSAMFVIPSCMTILMLYEYEKLVEKECRRNVQSFFLYGAVTVFICCVFWLRLFFTWFDAPLGALDTKIMQGPCAGIYTTGEKAEEYRELLDAINLCGITSRDKVLFLPIAALPLVYSDGEIATAYVTRFVVDSAELIEYYESHPHKIPSKIVITNYESEGYSVEEEKLVEYFEERGYRMRLMTDQVVILQRAGY